MENITLIIDGKNVSCQKGVTLLKAADDYGIEIPTLCYHPDLKPAGACRLCLVEDEKTKRLMASCVTPAAQNMVILTDSPRVIKHRRNIARLMMAEHPESCLVCNKGNRCKLRRIAARLGVGEIGLYPMPNYKRLEHVNPFIIRDLSKCILCGKCIRADHELVVVGAIDYNLRGFKSRPATVHDRALEQSSCTFCGTCVSMCPTGALAPKNTRYVGTPERESLSICGFCGVGCSLFLGVAKEQVVEVNPSHLHDTVNGATLCVRGYFAHDFLNAGERLTRPMVRNNGELVFTSWEEALERVAKRLLDIKRENGPQNVAFLGSSKCTNEENYIFQKMARSILKTNNVDNGGYIYGQSFWDRIDEKTGSRYGMQPLARLLEEEVIFVLGADPNQSVPVVGYYLKRAARQGIPLVIVDPRHTELVDFSSIWLRISPNSDLELINGLAALLFKGKGYDFDFIVRFTHGFDQYRAGLSCVDLDRSSRITGVDVSIMEVTAELLHGKKIAFVIGHGILKQRYGLQILDAIFNLSLMTGNLVSQGAGLYLIASENNQVGSRDMGAVPYALPCRKSLNDDEARRRFEDVWQTDISPDQGLNMVQMIEEAEKGSLKSIYIMGENPIRSLPQPDRVRKALDKLDFIVVQDIIRNETTEIADVVLPGAAFSEKGGSFTNLEGRIQSFELVVSPPGEAKPDWEIITLLTSKMGDGLSYRSLEEIRDEIIELVPMYAHRNGNRYAKWVDERGERKPLHVDGTQRGFSFCSLASTEEETFDDGYPFTAILGSCCYHLGSGTRTSYSKRIREMDSRGEVEISLEDGMNLGLNNGDTIRVISQFGSLKREIRLKRRIKAGLIFVPMAFHQNDARNLIRLSQLCTLDSSGWNTCKVKIEKI
ncbi:MAG: molybdopterin-dependent oxidoreductase [Thermodesulfobacteriota bacterium]|nr:molybdopterin-dependent oxidoreductase [Thermodesulfobacteriota bacterium]